MKRICFSRKAETETFSGDSAKYFIPPKKKTNSMKRTSSTTEGKEEEEELKVIKLNPLFLVQGIQFEGKYCIAESNIFDFHLPLAVIDLNERTVFEVTILF